MAEIGGSTTQSGIYFQNAVAARYMGRMLHPRSRPPGEQVVEVRVEAPEQVDDVVVTFADERRLYLQVKENIVVGDEAWKKLWADFDKQAQRFNSRDQLVLFLGTSHEKFSQLNEACKRAQGAQNPVEWADPGWAHW